MEIFQLVGVFEKNASRDKILEPLRSDCEGVRTAASNFSDTLNLLAKLAQLPAAIINHKDAGHQVRHTIANLARQQKEPEESPVRMYERIVKLRTGRPGFAVSHLARYSQQDESVAQGMSALFSAMVVGMWTAFETMAADLWKACLNARPRLGLIALNAAPSPADTDDETYRKRKTTFKIPAQLAAKKDFNLHTSMGTLLQNMWEFSRRNEARDAYVKVFPQHKKELRKIFDDEKLRWLVALRNAVVHNGGRADDEFLAAIGQHKVYSKLEPGQLIPIDGVVCRDFGLTVLENGTALLGIVDLWMHKNEA